MAKTAKKDLSKFSNPHISKMLREIAAAYEIQGENRFKIRAYDNAADAVEHATSEVKDLWEEGKLQEIPGIGASIAGHLDEFFKTGKVGHFEQVKKGLPPGMFEFLGIEGIGAKTAYRLARELKLKNLDDLKKAAEAGKIVDLPGFKEKSQELILKAVGEYKEGEGRMILPIAFKAAEKLIGEIMKMPGVKRADPLGSLRRMVATVGDIDIGIATTKPKKVVDAFVNLPDVARVLSAGRNKATVILKTGKQVDIYAFDPKRYGSLIQYFTGSKQHNIHLRSIAKGQGLSLSEHGVKKFKKGKIVGEPLEVKTEEEFYKMLDMPWIPPEIREDTGEIEAALKGKLPKLIRLKDIKGDIHTHTTNSTDGESEPEEMVEAAIELGYKYYGISDHAPSAQALGVRGAEKEILRRKREVEKLQKKYKDKIKLFFSAEVDITAAAEVELPDELMALFDYTTAAVHSSFHQPKEKMTARIVNALKNPCVNVIGHPTGRLLGKRESYEVDWEKVFKTAVKEGKFLEINAFPTRLDLPDTLIREAKKHGVKFVINTDAHHFSHLDNMRFGVATARRGWCGKSDIINTLSIKGFVEAMRIKRRR